LTTHPSNDPSSVGWVKKGNGKDEECSVILTIQIPDYAHLALYATLASKARQQPNEEVSLQ